jgi:hypothetical protein
VVVDDSGHGAYFTSALINKNGRDQSPPADPVGGSFGRTADGPSLDGQAFEVAAVLAVAEPVMTELGGNPLRISLHHVSIEEGCELPLDSTVSDDRLVKQGIKLWADGTPWIGNIAISFPYLDTPATRLAKIDGSRAGEVAMNYSRSDLDAILDRYSNSGRQMAFHVNGDLGFDIVLDADERALTKHSLLGTDHRWRVEHVGACRKDQFDRAGRLGVHVSMAPFQFYYWGDLFDGEMFDTEIGSQWQSFRDAFDSGASVSFHNDGSVSPPTPLLNIQTAITRRTSSGTLRGANQAVSLHEALQAQTINAARVLKRDHLVGSVAVGKVADFVELSSDPFDVEPRTWPSRSAFSAPGWVARESTWIPSPGTPRRSTTLNMRGSRITRIWATPVSAPVTSQSAVPPLSKVTAWEDRTARALFIGSTVFSASARGRCSTTRCLRCSARFSRS